MIQVHSKLMVFMGLLLISSPIYASNTSVTYDRYDVQQSCHYAPNWKFAGGPPQVTFSQDLFELFLGPSTTKYTYVYPMDSVTDFHHSQSFEGGVLTFIAKVKPTQREDGTIELAYSNVQGIFNNDTVVSCDYYNDFYKIAS